jgi:hypothetical protein
LSADSGQHQGAVGSVRRARFFRIVAVSTGDLGIGEERWARMGGRTGGCVIPNPTWVGCGGEPEGRHWSIPPARLLWRGRSEGHALSREPRRDKGG